MQYKGSCYEHIAVGVNIYLYGCVSLLAPECAVCLCVCVCVCVCVFVWDHIRVPAKNHITCQTSVPPPFLLGEKVRLLPNFQYKFKVLLGKKRRGGVFEGEVDSPMHTMKLDALLYKPRIKVLRMISEGVGWSQLVMGGLVGQNLKKRVANTGGVFIK